MDFNKIVNRKGTDSKKWSNMKLFFESEDLLPMWVADMDFESPEEVKNALLDRVEHGVFGYTWKQDSFYDSIIRWVKKRHNWDIKKEWILYTPGVVMGLNLGVLTLTNPGDKVIIQPPVYPPFRQVVENKDRVVIENNLFKKDDKFVMDIDNLKESIDDKTKLFMMCNPHNPVGRVWTKNELLEVGNICLENNIPIVSDEIHSDFIFEGNKHIPIATLSKELEQNTITLMAPSKTFNIAGLVTSFAIIPNEELRNKYIKAIEYMGIDNINIFGALGLEVAYNEGEKWLDNLLVYLEDNAKYAVDYIKENIKGIDVSMPDGTYLLWLDFNKFDKSADEIFIALQEIGKIALNDGRPYGDVADKFFRFNIGCPRSQVEEGLKRIEKVVKYLES